MAQHDYDIVNGTGVAFRGDINDVLEAIVTGNSGTTAPATTFPFQRWFDTTTAKLKIRNAANNAWIEFGPNTAATYMGLMADPMTTRGDMIVRGASAPQRIAQGGDKSIVASDGTDAIFRTRAALELVTFGLQTVWVPASAMLSRTTNGAAAGTAESTTNKVMTKSLDFDTTTQEFAQVAIRFPKSYNLSTMTFAPYWTAASGSGGVVFGLQAVALSNDDALDTAYGTEQTSTDTLITANDIHVGPTSAAITIAGTPAAADWISFQLKRNVSDGSDTLGVDAQFLGMALFFTTNASDDT